MVNFNENNEIDENINLEVDEAEGIESDIAEVEENNEDSKLDDLKDEKTDEVIEVVDYLNPSIIDVKIVDESKLKEYDDSISNAEEDFDYIGQISTIKEKDVVDGKVVGLTDREVLVDIGFKAEGIVYRSDYGIVPEIGDEIKVYVTTFEDKNGNILLSKERADFLTRWAQLKSQYENEQIIKGTVIRRVKGGMIVELGSVQAFLPGSQVDIKPVVDFDEYVGKEYEFKIVKFNEMRQNIVLSRKAILASDLMEKRQEVLGQMEVGMVLEGVVKNITDFGAFIDLGGIDGLLHITDITWGRINHPSEKLTLGQTIEVKVIDFDVEKVRVSLGMKQLTKEPWAEVIDKYKQDTIIKGKIVNMMNYGAFVELEDGIEGLIHISEISWIKHINHPSDVFKVGDEVEAKVLNLDIAEKKISLGVKQLEENPWDTIESKYGLETIHNGIVRNLTQFGAFVELEEGIDGLVHVSDLSWTKIIKHPKEFLNKGDKVKVKVLEVSKEERRLSLGIKQIEENPWDSMSSKFKIGSEVQAKTIKVLDKGVIFELKDNVEGIIPIRSLSLSQDELKNHYPIGKECTLFVSKIDQDYKKIILVADLDQINDNTESYKEEEIVDKLDIPQEIIDNIKSES